MFATLPQKCDLTVRRLLIFRHAKAERSIAGAVDRDRPLTAQGRKDAARIGAYMADRALLPDRVLISPALRVQETWTYAAKAFRRAPTAGSVERLYDAAPHTILAVIKQIPASAHTALLVGHNPGLHEVALMLVTAGDGEARKRLQEKLPTAGLVIIDFAIDDWCRVHPRSGRLEQFVTPKSLNAAAS